MENKRFSGFICVHLKFQGLALYERSLLIERADAWCKEHHGDTHKGVAGPWFRRGYKFYFRHKADAAHFKLVFG